MNTLDQLAETLGFNATAALVAWYGDAALWVPNAPEPHILSFVLGDAKYKRLVAEFGGQRLWISDALVEQRMRRDKRIYEMEGTNAEIALTLGLSKRRVEQIKAKMVGLRSG